MGGIADRYDREVACPRCGSDLRETISGGTYRCLNTAIVGAVPGGMAPNVGPAPMPVFGTCGTVYDDAASSAADAHFGAMASAQAAEHQRQAAASAAVASDRRSREDALRARLGSASNEVERLCLGISLILTQTGNDGRGPGLLSAQVDDLRAIAPRMVPATWKWNSDVRCLIVYEPKGIATWFAQEAARRSLPTDGDFTWTETLRFQRTRERATAGWRVGQSTFARGDSQVFDAWVFPDGGCALSAVPENYKGKRSIGSPNFSPQAVGGLVWRLGLVG